MVLVLQNVCLKVVKMVNYMSFSIKFQRDFMYELPVEMSEASQLI